MTVGSTYAGLRGLDLPQRTVFLTVNRSKRIVTLDLGGASGREDALLPDLPTWKRR